ncbi:MBL fold metallo-hydrolase [Carnobacteriaceae bacterium zg-ZUI240]|nr:MBL fold metallo-hydrolase [Carnobacteriaceae bacterium zg-ZUI240]
MNYFTVEQVTERIFRIQSRFGVCCYVVQGRQKAIVIDTTLGIGHLKNVVEKLVTTPYEIVLTHAHIDHASGLSEFSVPMYLHQDDWALYDTHCGDAHRETIFFKTDIFDGANQVPKEDFIPYGAVDFLPIEDGQTMPLGDLDLVCYHVPGHTKGSIVIYVPQEKILITGDAIGENTLIIFEESATIKTHYQSLKKLVSLQLPIDMVLRQHGSNVSVPCVLENNLALAKQILEHCDDRVPTTTYGVCCFKGKDLQLYQEDDARRIGNIYYIDALVD